MAEAGSNGTVTNSGVTPVRDYASSGEKPKIRRVLLACFLCGVCAPVAVALIAAAIAFSFTSATAALGLPPSQFGERGGFMTGAFLAVMVAGFNWMLFYIVIPVTWIILFLSIGRFPGRGITRPLPYYRWGVIWGALLVATPTSLFGLSVDGSGFLGALATGLAIGLLAGLICASLFLAIVRPQQQVQQIATDVF